MDLTQEEVDDFLAAGKRVVAPAMKWTDVSQDVARWTVPVEIAAANVGTLDLFTSRSVPRNWKFKLSKAGEELLQWHFVPKGRPSCHKNHGSCPTNFPSKVEIGEQEHLWAPGLGCHCARPLSTSLQDVTDHGIVLERFCARARIELATAYSAPVSDQEQLGGVG